MPTIALNSHETSVDGTRGTEPCVISIPDAERLVLQSRFVRNQLEAEILSDIEARIRRATLLEPSAVPGDLVTMNSRVVLREVDTCRQHFFVLAFPSCANSRKGTDLGSYPTRFYSAGGACRPDTYVSDLRNSHDRCRRFHTAPA